MNLRKIYRSHQAVALLTAWLAELGDIQDLSVAMLPMEDAMCELFAQNRSAL